MSGRYVWGHVRGDTCWGKRPFCGEVRRLSPGQGITWIKLGGFSLQLGQDAKFPTEARFGQLQDEEEEGPRYVRSSGLTLER